MVVKSCPIGTILPHYGERFTQKKRKLPENFPLLAVTIGTFWKISSFFAKLSRWGY
jgi:hypothetical protein